MKNPRTIGLALILLGVVVLLGNTTEALPPEAFFAGLVLYPIGGLLFFQGSRAALRDTEDRTANFHRPTRAKQTAEQRTDIRSQGSAEHGLVDEPLHSIETIPRETLRAEPFPQNDHQRFLDEIDADLGVENEDISPTREAALPIDVPQQDSLAEQITKLHKLREDGVISEEEMAIAKAKLFG